MIKDWLGRNFTPLARGIFTQEYFARSPIAKAIVEQAHAGRQTQAELMNRILEDGVVTPQEFQEFAEHFARGIDYVYDLLGNHIDEFVFKGDQYGSRVHYNVETQQTVLIISALDIIEFAEVNRLPNEYKFDTKTYPYIVTAAQMATLNGAEEAYHAYQFKCHYHRYADQIWSPGDLADRPDNHDELPMEKDAEMLVRQAAEHFGFFTRLSKTALDNTAGSGTTASQRQRKPR